MVIAPNLGIARLSVHDKHGRSVVTEQYSQAPLQLHRPLYLDDDNFPTVFLKTPSAGLLDGDRHDFSLFAHPKSKIKICNQAATLVYPGASKQTITIKIDNDATVYFEPCPLILAARASLTQVVRIYMESTAKLHYVDEWSAGRIAMDECFLFERFDNTIEIFVGDKLEYRERFVLEPLNQSPRTPSIAGNFTRFKSIYRFGQWEQIDQAPAAIEAEMVWQLKRKSGTISRSLSVPAPAKV